MKLLVFNRKLKVYDVLDVFDEKLKDFVQRVRSEGLFYRKIKNEEKIEQKLRHKGYSREKYY